MCEMGPDVPLDNRSGPPWVRGRGTKCGLARTIAVVSRLCLDQTGDTGRADSAILDMRKFDRPVKINNDSAPARSSILSTSRGPTFYSQALCIESSFPFGVEACSSAAATDSMIPRE